MPVIARLLTADGPDFVSRSVPHLTLTFAGIPGDRHEGLVRGADVRTPWHPRGTPIANTRQLSILSEEELAEVAEALQLDAVDPALLGCNIVLAGVPELSFLGPATRLQFPSGATVFVTEHNAPCRHPGDRLAAAHGVPTLASSFPKAAIGRRGLVGMVEREGALAVADEVRVIASPAAITARPRGAR